MIGLREVHRISTGRAFLAWLLPFLVFSCVMAVLVAGLLYVGQYRQGLIDNEISALTIQAEMFAAALGEAAVGAEGSKQFLKRDTALQIVRRLDSTFCRN